MFFSRTCEYCASKPDIEKCHVGYIIVQDEITDGGEFHYVFPTIGCAYRWQFYQSKIGTIRKILSYEEFVWRKPRGTTRDIELADRMFEVFPNHKFMQGHGRAFLAPDDT